MWLLWLLLYISRLQPVTSKSAVSLVLVGGSGPCEGRPEAFYKNEWGHVGDKYWNRSTEEVVCRSTFCGSPVENSTVDVPKRYQKTWLDELKCKGNEKELQDCDTPGLGISLHKWPTVKKIKCSNVIKLKLEGFKCSGAVQYSIEGKPDIGYFCNDKWNTREANLLCQSLGCGESEEIPPPGWVEAKNFQKSRKMRIDCSKIKNVTHLWQCAIDNSPPQSKCSNPASVTCKGHKRLRVSGNSSNVCSGLLEERRNNKWVPATDNIASPDAKCKQMNCGSHGSVMKDKNNQQLTCSDKVNVVLTDKNQESECYGLVNVKVNGSIRPVCATSWTEEEAAIVCKELGCGKVVETGGSNQSPRTVIMDSIKCEKDDSSLWHCQARHNRNVRCPSSAYVICSESVKGRLEDGPGKCAGRVMIQHEGRMKSVLESDWRKEYSDVICKHLKCGKSKTDKPGNLGQISDGVVTVNCPIQSPNITNINECEIRNRELSPREDPKAVEITCEGHKVLFFKSAHSCAGEVGIMQGDKNYLLSGSSTTWNQDTANLVCRQMHCGVANNYTFTSSGDRSSDVWGEAYDCSSNDNSLFECKEVTPPSDHNHYIASVTCSGTRTVSLTNGCWGVVRACAEGECGDVCGYTWTKEHSLMLCKSQGCGDNVLQAQGRPTSGKILFKALHVTNQTTDLSQCNFVKKQENDKSCGQNPAYVVCSGSVEPRFEMNRDKCSGNVAMVYEGKPLPVCSSALTDNATQNIICRQLKCGQALKTLAYFGSNPGTSPVISGIECSTDNSSSLSTCKINSVKKSCTFGGIQCSDWKAMHFQQTCSGVVSVHSKGKEHLVSSEGWGEKEGNRLCEDMKCGRFESKKEIIPEPHEVNSFWNRNFICGDNQVTNIWECEKTTSPSQKKKLLIKCHDESKVKLSKKCHGALMIGNTHVCRHAWESKYSHMVCQEQDCGNALEDATPDDLQVPPNTFHVDCEEHHYQLGQCKRVEGKCTEKSLVSVYCVGNIEFQTTQFCGGVIQVKYQSIWQEVCMPKTLSIDMKNKLCKAMNCGDYNATVTTPTEKIPVDLEMSLQCTEETFDIKYCVKKQPCPKTLPAEIYCQGYQEPVKPPPIPEPPSLNLIIGGVFLVILAVVLFALLLFVVTRRGKKVRALSRKLSRTDESLKSGSYEDVANKDNEMENFRNGRFRSGSNSSYDDVDNAVEDQPLDAARDVATAASRKSFTSEDHVTYEVEDPLDNYDDIEATQTEAEVHVSTATSPESDASAALEA